MARAEHGSALEKPSSRPCAAPPRLSCPGKKDLEHPESASLPPLPALPVRPARGRAKLLQVSVPAKAGEGAVTQGCGARDPPGPAPRVHRLPGARTPTPTAPRFPPNQRPRTPQRRRQTLHPAPQPRRSLDPSALTVPGAQSARAPGPDPHPGRHSGPFRPASLRRAELRDSGGGTAGRACVRGERAAGARRTRSRARRRWNPSARPRALPRLRPPPSGPVRPLPGPPHLGSPAAPGEDTAGASQRLPLASRRRNRVCPPHPALQLGPLLAPPVPTRSRPPLSQHRPPRWSTAPRSPCRRPARGLADALLGRGLKVQRTLGLARAEVNQERTTRWPQVLGARRWGRGAGSGVQNLNPRWGAPVLPEDQGFQGGCLVPLCDFGQMPAPLCA